MDDFREGGEALLDGLVDEVSVVCEAEGLVHEVAGEEEVDNLEGHKGLAGACRHDEEDPRLLASDDGRDEIELDVPLRSYVSCCGSWSWGGVFCGRRERA